MNDTNSGVNPKILKGQYNNIVLLRDANGDEYLFRYPNVKDIISYKINLEIDNKAAMMYLVDSCLISGNKPLPKSIFTAITDVLSLKLAIPLTDELYKNEVLNNKDTLLDIIYLISSLSNTGIDYYINLTIPELVHHIVSFERTFNIGILSETPQVDGVSVHQHILAAVNKNKKYANVTEAMRKLQEESKKLKEVIDKRSANQLMKDE